MPWQRVDDIDDYRLNTRKIENWLKGKWGDYDYEVEVGFCRYLCHPYAIPMPYRAALAFRLHVDILSMRKARLRLLFILVLGAQVRGGSVGWRL